MSRCYDYDFQKWTMITLASVAINLTIGLTGLAHGQLETQTPLDVPIKEEIRRICLDEMIKAEEMARARGENN